MAVRKKGRYYHYDFTIKNTRFRGSTKAKTAAEAKEIEAGLYRKSVTGKTTMTLSQVFGKYWTEHASGLPSADTIDYQSTNLTTRLGEKTLLVDLQTKHISEYIARRRGEVSDSSVNRELTLLRAVLKRAENAWQISTPKIFWKALFLTEPDHRNRYLKHEEAERLISAAHADIKPIILLAIYTGLRRENCLGLKEKEIDWDNRSITLKVKSRKPGGKVHTVYLNDEAYSALDELPKRPKMFNTTNFRRRWEKAVRVSGLGICFHDLRHTAATWMVQNGVNLVDVKEAMGHEDIQTTLRYAHHSKDTKRAAFEKIQAGIGPNAKKTPMKPAENREKVA